MLKVEKSFSSSLCRQSGGDINVANVILKLIINIIVPRVI